MSTARRTALAARLRRVRLLLLDVDGVMTDGRLFYVPGPDGAMVETKGFDTQDGVGLIWAHEAGLVTGLISGRDSPAVVARAEMLRFTYVYQGRLAKVASYEEILAKAGVTDEQAAFVGDDLTDAAVMVRAGLAVAVQNARPEVKRIAHYVTRQPGGHGAVREVVELLLQAQGKWAGILEKYGLARARHRAPSGHPSPL
jgi:3-deoxy-D-manno-octulosonate 8-phosphate phosphatase (KDO 8-P phosphatase)